ncbi:MAG: hypothetical protein KJ799_18155 [Bacteroidetes bacterium]|nr:hypothetical protein [Bacteroidota bacterium]
MKNVFLKTVLILFVFTTCNFAQAKKGWKSDDSTFTKGDFRGRALMMKDLNLSDEQKEKIANIREEHFESMKPLREKHRAEMQKLTAENRKAVHDKIMAELTDDQKVKFEEFKDDFPMRKRAEMRESKREKFRAQREGRFGEFPMIKDKLNLTEEQEDAIHDLVKSKRKEFRGERKQRSEREPLLPQLKDELKEILDADQMKVLEDHWKERKEEMKKN